MKAQNWDISYVGENSHAVYYRLGQEITVIVGRQRYNCMTCNKADSCAHTEAVRRYLHDPIKKKTEAAA